MAENSDLERTEPASSRRLEQAREEGQIPHSRELSSFLVLMAGTAGLWTLGPGLAGSIATIVRRGLTVDRNAAFDSEALPHFFLSMTGDALLALIPFFLVLIGAALATPFLLGGFNFSTKAFSPDFTRMSPLKGLGRMFSVNSVAELVKAVLKSLLVASVSVWVMMHQQEAVFSLIGQPIDVGLQSVGQVLIFSALVIVSSLALIAAIDVPYQLWQYYSRLRMTKEEAKQEFKELEGDPQVKGRIRSMQRERARQRMMSAVPKAQVVVTNPTHYAIALQYDEHHPAPRVVAKGAGLIAQKIREIAQANGVPLLEAPPLARALFRHTEIGDLIPPTLYRAVAEVMAYVYQLNHYVANGGFAPVTPADLPVPSELDPGAA